LKLKKKEFFVEEVAAARVAEGEEGEEGVEAEEHTGLVLRVARACLSGG